ncbi:DUF6270 domain-containing protein [Brevibacterium antiquum]|nr:DUF6270 domain-containing protein [Brevibacterium antiquum]
MKIAVFGSCVSRDICEFIPASDVAAYVARQSSIVSLGPVGANTFPSGHLESAFQTKMFVGDQKADAIERLISSSPDVILIDLVDERRGVWKFPNGTYLTNSVEAYRAGANKWAPQAGARLLEFGSDEHFSLWSSAFCCQVEQLGDAGLLRRAIFLNVEWASALAGQTRPSRGARHAIGRRTRRLRRRFRLSRRKFRRGQSLISSLRVGQEMTETQAESFARRARQANLMRKRYASHVESLIENRVIRIDEVLRIDSNNRWGAEPFHYRESDYASMASEIANIARRFSSD